MKVELFGSTDVGQVRDHNEDNFVLCRDLTTQDWSFKRDEAFELGDLGTVLFVADGMGGTNAGEVASDVAQAYVNEAFSKLTVLPGKGSDNDIMKFLKDVIKDAHKKIVNLSLENPTYAGMGTTAVIAWILKDVVYVAWSGDSRMYIYRDGEELYPSTDDHSMVWDLVKQGQLNPEQARIHEMSNIITQSLGDDSRSPKPDARKFDLYKGDRLMLCSDGLCGMLSDAVMGGMLSSRSDTAETCKELIAAANAAGGTDNITVLLLDVLEGKPAPPPKKKQAVTSGGTIPTATSTAGGGSKTPIIAGVVAVILIALTAWYFTSNNGPTVPPGDGADSLGTEIDTALAPEPEVVPAEVTEEPIEAEEPTETPTPKPVESNNNTVESGSTAKEGEEPVADTPKPKPDTTKPKPGLQGITPKQTTDTIQEDAPASPPALTPIDNKNKKLPADTGQTKLGQP